MEHIGFKLLDEQGDVVEQWGGAFGHPPVLPNPLVLPNGDQVCGAVVGETYGAREATEEEPAQSGWTLVPWLAVKPLTIQDVVAERERRLGLGFDYDFGDARGTHRIGTTEADMKGWTEVSTASQAAINLGQPTAPIALVTDTGPVTVTAQEWQAILLTAAQVRQPIWAASFLISAMNPIPADYTNDQYWTQGE